jgi:5-methylcytosine-specific restriction enzyme B
VWLSSGEHLGEEHPFLKGEVLSGIGSGGPGFNNHRWRELVFLISLVGDLKQRRSENDADFMKIHDHF